MTLVKVALVPYSFWLWEQVTLATDVREAEMKIKYLERRERAGGRILWVFNPPATIRNAIPEAKYEQFEVKADAEDYAKAILEAYDDHKRGVEHQLRIQRDTVDGLMSYYKQSNAYQKLSANSKRLYGSMMRQASEFRIGEATKTLGQMKSMGVTPDHADKLYQMLKDTKSAHRAVSVCKVLRKVWFVGMRGGRVRNNPFQKMGLEGLEDRKVLWEPEHVAKFVETADDLGIPSVGTLALLCYDLCQRPGDMRQLRWDDIRNGAVYFTQEKTKTEMIIPLSPRLHERLSLITKHSSGYVVVCEATQKPFDRRLYAKWAVRVRNEAKLPVELQLRDLRRTGATEMAEAGCTEDELRSVTGHQSRDVLSIYVRPTTKLAQAGINKRFQ